MKEVKGYNGKYTIDEEGRLYKRTDEGYEEKFAQANGQVFLYKDGERYRPLLKTVVEDTLGTAPEKERIYDSVMLRKLKRTYKNEQTRKQFTNKELDEIDNFMERMEVELDQNLITGVEGELKMGTEMSMERVSGIYELRCAEDGRVYVGSSTNIRARAVGHEQMLQAGDHHCKALQDAWDEYGADAFTLHVVLESDKEDLRRQEQIRMDLHKDGVIYNTVKAKRHFDEDIRQMREEYWNSESDQQWLLRKRAIDTAYGYYVWYKDILTGRKRAEAGGPTGSIDHF